MSAEATAVSLPEEAAPAGATSFAPMVSVKTLDKGQREKLYSELGLWERGFTVGVMNMFVNVLVLARWPQYFWILHLFLGAVFLPWRFLRFVKRGWEWYMTDFCYFVTYFTVLGCMLALVRSTMDISNIFYEYNYEAIRAGFAFANGALVLAVPLFGNKIVFHDVDNTTSVYIHLSPALMFWTLRWGGGFGTSLIEQTWPGMFAVCRDMQEADAGVNDFLGRIWYNGPCNGTPFEFIVLPALFWIILWGVPYYLLNFCLFKDYIARNNKENLFVSTIKDKRGVGRFVTKLPPKWQPLGFMVQHFLFAVTAGFASIILWGSFLLHTAVLFGTFAWAVHNGSSYMFRVVAARHVQGVVEDVAKPRAVPEEIVGPASPKKADEGPSPTRAGSRV